MVPRFLFVHVFLATTLVAAAVIRSTRDTANCSQCHGFGVADITALEYGLRSGDGSDTAPQSDATAIEYGLRAVAESQTDATAIEYGRRGDGAPDASMVEYRLRAEDGDTGPQIDVTAIEYGRSDDAVPQSDATLMEY
ncbi:hypothetical protein C8R45DRAFT_1043778 [Mycena sanguinolenta]|nr:hypothetical protein C8R45DRAFT_1043778 [Mycena sanguinolenta]